MAYAIQHRKKDWSGKVRWINVDAPIASMREARERMEGRRGADWRIKGIIGPRQATNPAVSKAKGRTATLKNFTGTVSIQPNGDVRITSKKGR